MQRLEFYSLQELTQIVGRSAAKRSCHGDRGRNRNLSAFARNPRISNRLLRRVRDFAQVKGDGVVTQQIADAALNMLNVDKEGFDTMDRRLMAAIVEQFAGGPVGLDAVAAAISEEKGTIEDVIEPYLIQQGYLVRTPRGRVATSKCYLHLGLEVPESIVNAAGEKRQQNLPNLSD